MRKNKTAGLAKKLWSDVAFKKELMKDLKAGAVAISGDVIKVEIGEQEISDSEISVSVSKCGAPNKCYNHASDCTASVAPANPVVPVII